MKKPRTEAAGVLLTLCEHIDGCLSFVTNFYLESFHFMYNNSNDLSIYKFFAN